MMRIILLLLVTLTEPFCAFPQASTLVVPTANDTTPETNPVSNTPAFNKTEELAPQDVGSTSEPAPEATEAATSTEKVPVVSTAAPVIQSETTAPTDITAPTDTTQSTEAGPEETTGSEATTVHKVEETEKAEDKESDTEKVNVEEEGMSTGQLVGIVIGALITVIVVIAVIILVVRRMGQYSP